MHSRIPNRAIGRRRRPVSVVVQVFVTYCSGSHISGRIRRDLAPLAYLAPIVKTISRRNPGACVRKGLSRAESELLSFTHPHSISLAGRFPIAAAHGNPALVLLWYHIKAVLARSFNGVRKIRRIHLNNFSLIQITHRQVQSALVQLNLRCIVVQIRNRDARFAPQAQRCRSHRQLHLRTAICPDPICCRQRTIQVSRNPVVNSPRLKRNRAINVLQPQYPAWRIALYILRRRPSADRQNHNGDEQLKSHRSHGSLLTFPRRAAREDSLLCRLSRMLNPDHDVRLRRLENLSRPKLQIGKAKRIA